MTIEEINKIAQQAAASGDMDALEAALKAREEAIHHLMRSEPSEHTAARVRNAIAAGESIDRELRGFKNRASKLRDALTLPSPPHVNVVG